MTGVEKPQAPASRASLRARLYLTGVVAIIAGLVAAVVIYALAPGKDSAVSLYAIADPRYQAELQQIGGNAAVFAAQLHQWFDGLWHGKTLAFTVAVLGAAVAGVCFFIGHFFAYDDPSSAEGG